MPKKVFVAMSGGVDSSVAAALLRERGFDVVGIHMRCWNLDGCGERDAEDARRVAEHLGIPFYVLDFEREYKDKVVRYMVDGYRCGITPNPDVVCNREIKFGFFLEKAVSMGAEHVATGHYVKLKTSNSKPKIYSLHQARDLHKDQSYFLWTLTQEQLRHCLFPIGGYTKPQVRKLAKKFELPNAEKKDSQGICFLGQVSVPEFLSRYIKPKRGLVLDTEGSVLGEHRGAWYYTIGQRHLGINLQKRTKTHDQKPHYVASKDVRANTIVVAEGESNQALYRNEVELRDIHFIRGRRPPGTRSLTVRARVRYRQSLVQGVLEISTRNRKRGKLSFATPQKSIAPGQSAVFYSKSGEMLGGGIIA
jgi:tRNA-specific 2-thiouridylase